MTLIVFIFLSISMTISRIHNADKYRLDSDNVTRYTQRVPEKTENSQPKAAISPVTGARLDPKWQFKPGESGNAGGAPKGTRISTWMARFGEMPEEDIPQKGTPAYDKLPKNARIALSRLNRAEVEDGGEASTKIILDSTNDSGVTATDSLPVLQGIAAAIAALKAAGAMPAPVMEPKKEIEDAR